MGSKTIFWNSAIFSHPTSDTFTKIVIVFSASGDNGKLFGTVTTQEISENLRMQGIDLDRRKLQLKEPIKSLGDFDLSIKLHPEVTAIIKITVISV